jgi:N-acetylglucosamine-6-phosphate deacetylase
MIIKNGRILYLDKIEKADILIENGKITAIDSNIESDGDIIDAEGLYVSPGFIDVHIHGAMGSDVMDGTYEAINNISKAIAARGTTSFLATTMTCAGEDIKNALQAVQESINRGTEGANVLGVHLEGPFINKEMIGAQNPNFLQALSVKNFEEIAADYINIVKEVTLAPEMEGAEELIKYLAARGIVVSIGHTKANYDEVIESIKWGVSHSTHLFNAMKGLHHREAGTVGAIFDSDITTEMICDGIHLDYPVVRIVLKQKSTDKVLLVSDAMMACCMKSGEYELGGQKVLVKDSSARLESGVLAGSVLTLDQAVGNVRKNSKLPLHEIIKMLTFNAARHCGVQHRKGLIKKGYDADIILFDEDISIKKVLISGKVVV